MLVLSRKVGERIHIGNDIFIEVRRLAGSRVTLAVNAPKNVRILRGELMEAATAFDVLEEPTVSSSESTTDTVVMSGEDASA
ncbi:MAG: carbon storage regulator, partial [Pseudomonadales bacterium]